jgi:hypothetical protein
MRARSRLVLMSLGAVLAAGPAAAWDRQGGQPQPPPPRGFLAPPSQGYLLPPAGSYSPTHPRPQAPWPGYPPYAYQPGYPPYAYQPGYPPYGYQPGHPRQAFPPSAQGPSRRPAPGAETWRQEQRPRPGVPALPPQR